VGKWWLLNLNLQFSALDESALAIQKIFVYFKVPNQYPTNMTNSNQTLYKDGLSQLRAKMAIQRIQKSIETRFPVMAEGSKARLIIECLIELSEERKFLAKQ
jgi:hypothetical protein